MDKSYDGLVESEPLVMDTKGQQLQANWGTARYAVNYLNRSIFDAPLGQDDFV